MRIYIEIDIPDALPYPDEETFICMDKFRAAGLLWESKIEAYCIEWVFNNMPNHTFVEMTETYSGDGIGFIVT